MKNFIIECLTSWQMISISGGLTAFFIWAIIFPEKYFKLMSLLEALFRKFKRCIAKKLAKNKVFMRWLYSEETRIVHKTWKRADYE